MKTTVTITRKGQTTLPAPMRHKLGIPAEGGILKIEFDERKGEIILSRAPSIFELSARVSQHIKSGTTPLTDVNAYYQTNRRKK